MRPPTALRSKNKQIQAITKFFSAKKIEQLARETKFVQRDSPLSGLDFLMLCIFAHQQSELISLEGMCVELFKDGVRITKQSLQDRFNKNAVEFITQLLNEALSMRLDMKAGLTHPVFKRIVVWDSTQVQLPESFCTKYRGHGGGASAAGLKLQYGFDIISQKIIVMLVQDAVQSDLNQELHGLEKNDLRIEDLGYFNLNRFEKIVKGKAFFLSRHRFNVTVFEYRNQTYEELDLVKLTRRMKPGDRRIISVYLGQKEKLPVRMIVEKVPEQLASEKRRKLKSDNHNKRRGISRKRLLLCNLNIYITNTHEDQIPADQIRSYYSLRWQIEIVFKSWKSTYKIDRTKTMKLERFECLHLGTLILIVLTTNLMAVCRRNLFSLHHKELSEFKFFKLMKSSIYLLKDAVRNPKAKLLNFLVLIETMAMRNAAKEARTCKMTPYDILTMAA